MILDLISTDQRQHWPSNINYLTTMSSPTEQNHSNAAQDNHPDLPFFGGIHESSTTNDASYNRLAREPAVNSPNQTSDRTDCAPYSSADFKLPQKASGEKKSDSSGNIAEVSKK